MLGDPAPHRGSGAEQEARTTRQVAAGRTYASREVQRKRAARRDRSHLTAVPRSTPTFLRLVGFRPCRDMPMPGQKGMGARARDAWQSVQY
eukprot:1732047-Prymnesium_polylepis.2